MTIICAAAKGKEIAISCDTQSNYGSMKVSSKYIKNSSKLYEVNGSVMGVTGWCAIADMLEHLILNDASVFKLGNRMEIYGTLLQLHQKMKEVYHIEVRERDDQPVESSQLDALIVNRAGIFSIGSYREVNEYARFWAMGSGNRFALGAMHALYELDVNAKAIAEAGVKAATQFDDGCGLPLKTRVIRR